MKTHSFLIEHLESVMNMSLMTEVKINTSKLPKSSAKMEYYIPPVEKPHGSAFYLFVKRLFDFLLALIGLVVTAIPMGIIALVIKLDSPGPVIYRQERLGKGGKSFHILKFRSMQQDAEADGAQWADEDDPRVTRVGNILRKTRLDELPQLVNILAGQMSLVGPRPERPIFYAEFETYIHGFSNRLAVTPGLTGLAQVSGGYDLLPEEKIVYDMEYIKTRSLLLDLQCVLRTIGIVFNHNGAR